MFISSKISFFSSFPLSHHFSFKTKQFQNHKSNSNGSVLFYTALSYLYVLLFLHGVSLYLSVFISTCASLCVCVFLSMLCCGCFSTSMFPSCWLPGLEDVFSWPSQLHYDYFSLLPTSKNDSTIIGKKTYFLSALAPVSRERWLERETPLLVSTPHCLAV